MDLVDALITGARHSYGQVRDDLGSLLGGSYNPGTFGRMFDVLTELPIGKAIGKVQQSPLVNRIAHAGGPRYHGTPHVFDKVKISDEGLGGPGYYLTDLAEVAGDYARGDTFGGVNRLQRGPSGLQEAMQQAILAEKSWKNRSQQLLARGDTTGAADALSLSEEAYAMGSKLGPNIRKYQLKPHETFNMDKFLDPKDIARMREAAGKGYYATEAGQGARDLLGSLNVGNSANTGSDLMYALGSALMPINNASQKEAMNAVNKFLKHAGFGSVTMAGGTRQGVATSGPKHEAMSLLDLSLIEPYYNWLAAQRAGTAVK